MWWVHEVFHEVIISKAGDLEDIRWLTMVASQHNLQ
jgi:hypothetical protein